MVNWLIGLSTGCFYNQNILDCLPIIRESGFDTVEVCSSPKHLDYHDKSAVRKAAARLRELDLEPYSFHAPFSPNIDISSDDTAQRAASIKEILKAAEAAALLDVQYFVIHPGPEDPPPKRLEDELSRIVYVIDSLNQIVKRCHELGTMCVLENKLPHLIFGNTSEILWILDGIKGSEVGVCLDTGHAALAGELDNLLMKLHGRLQMIHAHDNLGTGDEHLPPGDGKINWVNLLRNLIEKEFHGAFILELAGTADSAITMMNARRGRAYLRKIVRHLLRREHT